MIRRIVTALASLAGLVAAGLVVASPASATTINVTCSANSLQTKIDGAAAGSTLLVKGICHGPFTVDKNLTLKGNPQATLDGDQLGSTITISGANLVHLTSLTVTGGFATNGGGIQQQLGTLVLNRVTVSGNQAGGDSTVRGGGISSTGTLSLENSSVVGNSAFAGDSGNTDAEGGGVYAEGPLHIAMSTVSGNSAVATSSGNNAEAFAGVAAIGSLVQITSSQIDRNRTTSVAAQQAVADAGGLYVLALSAHVSITGSTFDGNIVTARSTTSAGAEAGGLFVGSAQTTMTDSKANGNRCHVVAGADAGALACGALFRSRTTLSHSHFDGNVVSMSAGTTGVGGAAGVDAGGGPLVITSSTVSNDTAGLHAEQGLSGQGGGLEADNAATIRGSTFDRDRLVVVSSKGAPTVSGGAIAVSGVLTMTGSTVSNSLAEGTARGTNSITVQGGGVAVIAATTKATIRNSTISDDTATAISNPKLGTSTSQGGGVFSKSNNATILESTVSGNAVTGSGHTASLQGGGLFVGGGTTTLTDAILDLNLAPLTSGGQNCSGTVASDGHNVLGNVLGCSFASSTGDLTGVDPKLGPLAANGGPTRTRALLAGSPAIDHVPTAACPIRVDERGVHRPHGPACDSGAFEKS